jgi:hypothetical protein
MLERKLVYRCSPKRVISSLGRMYGSNRTLGWQVFDVLLKETSILR